MLTKSPPPKIGTVCLSVCQPNGAYTTCPIAAVFPHVWKIQNYITVQNYLFTPFFFFLGLQRMSRISDFYFSNRFSYVIFDRRYSSSEFVLLGGRRKRSEHEDSLILSSRHGILPLYHHRMGCEYVHRGRRKM